MFGEKGFQAYVSYADTEHERSMLLQFQQQTDKSLQISDRQYDRLGKLCITPENNTRRILEVLRIRMTLL